MKRLFRWLFRLLILAIVLLVALVLLKDIILKALAEARLRQETGMSVTIDKLELGLFSPTFAVEGLKLYNRPEFGGSVFLDAPQLYFEYDPRAAFLGWKVHLNLLRCTVGELHLIKNQLGQTNVLGLLAALGVPGMAAAPPAREVPKPAGQPAQTRGRRVEFGGIDRLYLSLGTVKYTDMQQPRQNWQRILNWKDQEERGLKTGDDLANWAARTVWQISRSPALSVTPGMDRRLSSPAPAPR